ncbi:DNA polymerase epsilon catalytic subunit [Theileria orientalis]|uniref:DNA polymerase epsilon catalytic subunit n=1 Tax=Theileria orientalis TaxID=68886 RepID=A0A976QW57_THEOR|nr:DNA polymerase epsilon catalytic subunit [Theileria orientalis]
MLEYGRTPAWNSNGKRNGFLYNVVVTTVKASVDLRQSSKLSGQIEHSSHDTDRFYSNKTASNVDNQLNSALSLYFISEDGTEWNTSVIHSPYFYVSVLKEEYIDVVLQFLYNKFQVNSIGPVLLEPCKKIDLSLPNHLEKVDPVEGVSKHNVATLIKISFKTIDQLERGRDMIAAMKRQYERDNLLINAANDYDEFDEDVSYNQVDRNMYDTYNLNNRDHLEYSIGEMSSSQKTLSNQTLRFIGNIYEHDVKYINRVCIDLSIRCGTWYEVQREDFNVKFVPMDKRSVAPLNVFAWDIECYKAPLKFPDMETDEIMLISVMFNGQGYLIVNRSLVSRDITEFLYRPREDIVGNAAFKIYNEKTERDLLVRFFSLLSQLRPQILVTYNGDNFDFPYVNRRAEINGLNMNRLAGFHLSNGVFVNAAVLNMDCYKWVERDSYLPFGSRTLKQVCKLMLKYSPVEIDPEDMVVMARTDPQKLAVYSVSDAVATYNLYIKFIHNFILALSYIVPLPPNEILRQGAGTMCENLLMAEAYANGILLPNKHTQKAIRFYTNPETEKQHLVYENTYIGGRVESLRCGIFRDDQVEQFELSAAAYDDLITNLDNLLIYWAKNNMSKITKQPLNLYEDEGYEGDGTRKLGEPSKRLKKIFEPFENFEDVYKELYLRLCRLRDESSIKTLQPTAIVTEKFCEKCSYYSESHLCQKRMKWKQRLEVSPIDKSQILVLLQNLKSRTYQGASASKYESRIKVEQEEDSEAESEESEGNVKVAFRTWDQLTEREQGAQLQKAVKNHSQKIFKKTKIYKEADVESIICQRENHFYVQTVMTFRDRRYTFKHLKKEGENELKALLKQGCSDPVKMKSVREKILINDSLQLAYKCILNSFYGYVKRTGSRWYSMEMGAIVTYTGASIIESARRLIDKIGIPIELDTDGIWCMLPDVFPAVLDLKYVSEGKTKTVELEYMTTVLNMLIANEWTNDQYLDLEDTGKYRTIKRNEIFFELDGPWHSMFLPASEKSEELLKKRYVVYNSNNQIVELKGFEIKRRGEMRLIQLFQEDIFPQYLLGTTKEDAYQSAAKVAMSYRRLLETRAQELKDDDLFELLLSRKTVKKAVNEQPHQKCFGITAARRLSELFKNDTYLNDPNIIMSFLLASHPQDAPRTARAIPIQTFKVDESVRSQYLSKWLKIQLSTASKMSSRDILDWEYYKERVDTQILKLICLPAIMQGLKNPIPEIEMPKWVKKKQAMMESRQRGIVTFFTTAKSASVLEPGALTGGDTTAASDTTAATADEDEVDVEVKAEEQEDWLDELKKRWLKSVANLKNMQKNKQAKINYNLYRELKGVLSKRVESRLDFDDYYALFTETWHIYDFELDPKDSSYVNCKVSIHNKPVILNVRVELWRKLYINNKNKFVIKADENVSIRELKDDYILPRGAKQMNLVELEMRESYYQKYLKNSIKSILYKTVAGVYESKIPISFDFMTRVGTMISLKNTEVSTVLNEDLEFKSNAISATNPVHTVDLKYMNDFEYVYMYVFQSQEAETKRRNRFFAVLFTKGDRSLNRIYVGGNIALNKYTEEQFSEISTPILEKYREMWAEKTAVNSDHYSNPYMFPDCFGTLFDTEIEASEAAATSCKNAIKKVDGYLNSLKPSLSKKKYFVYVYSSVDKSEFGQWAKGEYYPVFFDSTGKSHPQILSTLFMKSCFEDAVGLLYKHFSMLEEKMSLSRISAVPISVLLSLSNLEAFKCMFDVMYARALRLSSSLLWGTSEMGVDLGLIQANNLDHSDYDIHENENNLDFTLPGVYRCYGAKIRFNQSMMYNAILLQSKMMDFANYEKVETKNEDSEVVDLDTNFHVSMFHPNSFKILGTMLENLMNSTNLVYQKVDYATFQNIVNLCSYLKSWLSDTTSILYDPALYSMALGAMKEYLKKLVKHISVNHKLTTIHMDPTYMVIESDCISVTKGRTRVEEALIDLASTQSKFKNIPFRVEEEYVAMVQLDKVNYIRYKNYIDASRENCSENLKALEYMPLAVEMFIRYFMKTIALDPLWRSLRSFYESDSYEATEENYEPPNLVRTDFHKLAKKIQDRIYYDWYQPGSYFSRLYELISDTETFARTFDKNNKYLKMDFPMLPGTKLKESDDWKVEAIKLLLYIMQIDKSLDWTNYSLISSLDEKVHKLYMLTSQSEYTDRNWKAPSREFKLASLRCGHCHMVSDIDIVSTLSLFQNDEDETISYSWLCQICSKPFDSRQVEAKIIQYLENVFYAYQAQDSICPSCRSVKTVYRRNSCS